MSNRFVAARRRDLCPSYRKGEHSDGPGLLWENIGGFGAVGVWHPMLEKVDVQREELGAV